MFRETFVKNLYYKLESKRNVDTFALGLLFRSEVSVYSGI